MKKEQSAKSEDLNAQLAAVQAQLKREQSARAADGASAREGSPAQQNVTLS